MSPKIPECRPSVDDRSETRLRVLDTTRGPVLERHDDRTADDKMNDAQRSDLDEIHSRRIDAFVLRARRIEAHSLAQDREQLARLAQRVLTIVPSPSGALIREHLPPEEVVESAAARVRPLLLVKEDCSFVSALSSIKYFVPDPTVRHWVKAVGSEWRSRTTESHDARNTMGLQAYVTDTSSGASGSMSDVELALAWIYGDVVHADRDRRDKADIFGLAQRYRAAVPLVAYVMRGALNVLDGILEMHSRHVLPITPTVLTTDVVLESTKFTTRARVHTAAVGTPAPTDALTEFGEGWSELAPPDDLHSR
jgi:hypothetical protein